MTCATNIVSYYLIDNIANKIDEYMAIKDDFFFSFLLINKYEWYNLEGDLDRLMGPANILHTLQDQPIKETWMRKGTYHRMKHPAVITYHRNGIVAMEEWYCNGDRVFNDDGFTIMKFDERNKLVGVNGE